MAVQLENGVKILLHTEVRFLDYGESSGSGPWFKLSLPDPKLLDELRHLKGLKGTACPVLHLTLAEGDIAAITGEEKPPEAQPPSKPASSKAPKPPKGPYGAFAQMLVTAGFHHNPHVLEALGPDEQYQQWCRGRPCVVCGGGDWDEQLGRIVNQFAHVRRASNSGTGYKPKFSGVPLCGKHHQLQHQKGELEAYKAVPGIDPNPTVAIAKAFFDAEAVKHLERWAWEAMRETFGVDSMTMVNPHEFIDWAEEQGLGKFVTKKYREAAKRVDRPKQDHD